MLSLSRDVRAFCIVIAHSLFHSQIKNETCTTHDIKLCMEKFSTKQNPYRLLALLAVLLASEGRLLDGVLDCSL